MKNIRECFGDVCFSERKPNFIIEILFGTMIVLMVANVVAYAIWFFDWMLLSK